MNVQRTIGAFAVIGALAGCGSATDAVTFKPPPGFTPSVSVGPFMQAWSGPNKSMMMLMAMPTKMDLQKTISSSTVSNARIQKQSTIDICGNQPALYAQMIGNRQGSESPAAGAKDQKEQIEFLATNANGKTYMAMYLRPLGTPLDSKAEAALHNVCPR
jgi:hypothetical protein